MDFLSLAEKRFSCRKFKNTKIEQDKINLILEAGLIAPTAVNKQPQRIFVLTDDDKLKKLKECTKYTFDAPLSFVICVDKELAYNRGYDQKNSAEIDASIVTTHMMLEATDLGLGTTWVMAFNPAKIKEQFNIGDNLEIVALLQTGYPDDNVEISPLHTKHIDMSEMVGYNNI